MSIEQKFCPAYPITRGPRHHYFGYYDKTPWDATGRYLLAQEVGFMDRPPTAEDLLTIGLIDLQTEKFEPVAETHAWNWQQGCMLQWLPTAPDREVIYNDRVDGQFVAVILDIQSGKRRTLPRPIYALSHDGRLAVFPNFSRLAKNRPGYGYAGVPDPWEHVNQPADDGIYVMDLATGAHRLIISIDQIARLRPNPTMDGVVHWFNHLQFSPDDGRFIFLHRWRNPPVHWFTRLYTARSDGSEIRCLADDGMVSHFDWRDSSHVLAWARQKGQGDHYFLFDDQTGRAEVIGADVLLTDGHCSYSPDRRWILTDTYPDAGHNRTLLLYEPTTNRRIDLNRFYSPPDLTGELRCDLHPRWSRDGSWVCLDSAHDGSRQMYILKVSDVVGTDG